MATLCHTQDRDRSESLSVPSAGRSGWQPRFKDRPDLDHHFQYPQRVVVDGNPGSGSASRPWSDYFQYPQRVVVDGNLAADAHVVAC